MTPLEKSKIGRYFKSERFDLVSVANMPDVYLEGSNVKLIREGSQDDLKKAEGACSQALVFLSIATKQNLHSCKT
jgi:hypothetical protein